MIRFEHVSKAYLGGRQALQGVTFHMQPGEMAFLIIFISVFCIAALLFGVSDRSFRRREKYPPEADLWD